MTPQDFAILAVATSLEVYAKTGMKTNRAYTPRNMMAFAAKHTGIKFAARDYLGAAAALRRKLP
jgi:hypothetical protein